MACNHFQTLLVYVIEIGLKTGFQSKTKQNKFEGN